MSSILHSIDDLSIIKNTLSGSASPVSPSGFDLRRRGLRIRRLRQGLDALVALLKEPRLAEEVCVIETGCMGTAPSGL